MNNLILVHTLILRIYWSPIVWGIMRWTAQRREIVLVILSFTIYFFAYNLDTLAIDGGVTRKILYKTTGFGQTRIIGPDGRKPPGWRDSLETEIFGDWVWEEGHVVGHLRERSQPVVASRHGASWIWRKKPTRLSDDSLVSVHDALQRWGDSIPQTKVVAHVPGYTIIENVYIVNGTVYLVSDAHQSFPPLDAMVLTTGKGFQRWKVLSADQGRQILGPFGSTIRGVSWISADSDPHNSTLFALWRTYSSLDPLISPTGETTLPQPHRLFFPHNRFFTDANPEPEQYLARRRRFDTGFHPYTAKAAFPQLTIQDYEDWKDYTRMSIPFLFEKLVVADRQAAQSQDDNLTPFASTISLSVSPHWWEPIRRNLVRFLEVAPPHQPVVTYIHSQSEPDGLKLSAQDHEALVGALLPMGKKYGYEIRVVSSQTSDTDWQERMTQIAKSSVVIGVHGSHMMDSVFMQPTPRSTVMEFFPRETYAGDHESIVQSIGLAYMAWWDKELATSDFPPTVRPQNEMVTIDPPSIVRAIHKALS